MGPERGLGSFRMGPFTGMGWPGLGPDHVCGRWMRGGLSALRGCFIHGVAGQVIMTTIGGKVHALRVV